MRPRARPIDPYAVLGVPPGAGRAEIRRAYRRRALDLHPDVAGADATEEMVRLNEARDRLLPRGSVRHGGEGPTGDGASNDGAANDPTPPGERAAPRERPAWASAHGPAWHDYWAAWNDLPRRD
jgi:molecular chaperone DnaJ